MKLKISLILLLLVFVAAIAGFAMNNNLKIIWSGILRLVAGRLL